MRRRKWQRIAAFAVSAAMVFSTSSMQTLAGEIGEILHAEETEGIVSNEELSDVVLSDEHTDSDASQGIDVLSDDSEDSVLFIEDIEVSSQAEAELAAGGDASSNIEETPLMEVEAVLTAEESEKDSDSNRRSAGEAQWVTITAKDRSNNSQGEATVRIYLTNPATNEPAEDVEVLLFDERPDELPENPKELPLNLEDALNGNEDLYVERVQEYEKDENGEYKKDDEGSYIVEKDYLQFTLPAGGEAEFEAAFLYETDAQEYEYSVLASARALQSVDGESSSVLYDDYDEDDKDRDNELMLTWTSEAGSESESEIRSELSSETESEIESQSEPAVETESELSSEAESEIESQSETAVETESELSSEAESEIESQSETAVESESEAESEPDSECEPASEMESESETELPSESESKTETEADLSAIGDVPVSSIRVTMTKELESAAETETSENTEASENTEDAADTEAASETASETSENTEDANAADTAVSGQTYIVHVQAEDLQPEAQYDSTVSIHLTDYATGLPADDVITTVCRTKEEIQSADPAAVTTLAGAVQTPEGTKDLNVTRVQAAKTAEDGTETVADDCLKFSLPAGSSADFYIGFTYATEAAAYEKQLMIEVEAVQYIPVSEAASSETAEQTNTPNDNFSDIFSSKAEGQETKESTDQNAEYPAADQGLLPEATLTGNDDLSVKTQSADMEVILADESGEGSADSGNAEISGDEIPAEDAETSPEAENIIIEENHTADDTASTVLGAYEDADSDLELVTAVTVDADSETAENVVAVNVLESESDSVVMLWATSGRTLQPGDWLFLDVSAVSDWNKSKAVTTLRYEDSNGSWQRVVMEAYTYEGYGEKELYRVKIPNDAKGEFKFTRDNPSTKDVWNWLPGGSNLSLTANSNSNVYKATSVLAGSWIADTWIKVNYGGETLYFVNMTGSALTDLKAVFKLSTDSTATAEVTMTADLSGYYQVIIPDDKDYDTVTFKAGDTELAAETILGGGYAPSSTNTFYYGATEKTATELLHTWGSYPGEKSIAGKKLYFDDSTFSVSSAGTLQIGDGEAVELTADASDSSVLSYQIPDDSTATQQTILTYTATDGTKYHFLWGDLTKNLLTKTNEIAAVSDTFLRAVTVYFDATLSKLQYFENDAGSGADNWSIPAYGNTVIYYYATGTGVTATSGSMSKITGSDVYKVSLSKGYTHITFSSVSISSSSPDKDHGKNTEKQEIPMGLTNPCFYADSSDDAIYENKYRDGYWDELGSVRDAEAGKDTDVVDISQEAFVQQSETLYINTTFYDYYTDYELNGKNRDDYGGSNGASYRNWVNFRQFNQALSAYYTNCNAAIPIYTGHFQPTEYNSWTFNAIAATLNLKGFSSAYQNFISTNNSGYDIYRNSEKYEYAAQGLVNSTLSNGLPTVKNGTAVLPHFNEAFLAGENSKNAVLGQVYSNVAFPFTKKDVNDDGVDYWYFDSKDTTLAMKEDTNGSGYYLKDVGKHDWSKNVNSTGGTGGSDKVSTTYGFFPFNENTTSTSGKNYNYGFGTKIEFKFRLTEKGTVVNKNGKEVPIKFQFSGDDDVWVFIDGNLALDIGGAHGRVTGTIDFSGTSTTKKATVSKVKASAGSGSSGSDLENSFTINGSNQSEHTLTMFYMERGMWESNMKIMFNFPDENQLQVEKQVDTTEVNDLFKSIFNTNTLFKYSIQNLATHYGTKPTSIEVKDAVEVNLRSAGLTAGSNGKFRISGTLQDNTAVMDKNNANGVVYWYCSTNDSSASNRSSRSGTITLPQSVSTSGYKYLEFKFWYNWSDTPSLSNMYFELYNGSTQLTTSSVSKYLVSASSVEHDKWVTVKLDLDKMLGTGHNATVTSIKFSYNYARNVYLKDIVFKPTTEVSAAEAGFITQQPEIPDYGSSSTGSLQLAVNALYSSSLKTGSTYRVDEKGNFWLNDGETVTFNDQFRRGSYIALREELTEAEDVLYDTTWTMYENDKVVTSIGTGNTVTSDGTVNSLRNVSSAAVDDGRTEYLPTDNELQTNNSYNGSQPSKETFVFRSYAAPDDEVTTTKLKVVFNNKVNVGSLTLKKEQAAESDDLAENTVYTFEVVFTNVGGCSLEAGETIKTTVRLKKGEAKTITGIPLGTHYTITELAAEDDSTLDSVAGVTGTIASGGTYEGAEDVDFDKEKRTVEGDVTADISAYSYIFKNAIKPVVSLELKKAWQNSDGTELTENVPGTIFVQLQRRPKNGDTWEAVQGYGEVEVYPGDGQTWETYTYKFQNLDQYVSLSAESRTEYEYQVVELQWDDAQEKYAPVEDGGTFSQIYKVTYGDVSLKSVTGTGEVDPVYTQTITNRLKPTVTNLKITKVDSANNSTKLSGVTFTLDKVVEAEGGSIVIGGKSYNTVSAEEFTQVRSVTDSNGIAIFENLSDGIYILQERATLSTYNLLTDKILVVISREGTCSITGSNALVSPNGGGTVTIDETENAISCTIANVQRTKLQITKKAAGGDTLLNGVEFKLEKKKSSGEGYDLIDTKVTENGLVSFENLEDGSYLLTETKAASGYSLLKSPIEIVITRAGDGKYTVDGQTETIQNGVINLTVYNQSKFSIPATGSWSNYIITFAGAIIAGAALIMYLLSKRRKEGRAS